MTEQPELSILNPMHSAAKEVGAIHWRAPLFDPSGYAEEARHFLLALDERGITLSAESIRWSDRKSALRASDESRLLRMAGTAPRPGAVLVNHIFPPHFVRRGDASINVGRTMFETDRLPESWVSCCNEMDQIWVPSEFNRETFARAGVRREKLVVVPGAINLEGYDPKLQPMEIEGARGFNFLSVFDWSLRKGWDVLLRAFVEEFSPDEDVALIIKTHSSLGYGMDTIEQEIVQFIGRTLGKEMDRTPEIILQDTNLPAHRMPSLYRAADCFVLPTRGEGWGRPYMEAMAMGLPTIGTNWSGNTAFMNAENSYLINCELVDVPEPGWREAATFRGHRWAEPDSTHLRILMRRIFSGRDSANHKGRAAREDIGKRFSYDRVSSIITETISAAAERTLAAA